MEKKNRYCRIELFHANILIFLKLSTDELYKLLKWVFNYFTHKSIKRGLNQDLLLWW